MKLKLHTAAAFLAICLWALVGWAQAPADAPAETPAAPAVEDAGADKPNESRTVRERQEEIYESYERLVRVMEIVKSRYVRPVESSDLFDGAIRGILESLDPYSSYISPERYRAFMEETEQQFSGIGITISFEEDRIQVLSTLEGMPAFESGVQPGDIIAKVGDLPVEDIGGLEDIARLLRGPEGTDVTVTLFRPSTSSEYTVTLKRAEIPVSSLRGYRFDPNTGKWDFLVDAKAGVGYIRLTKFAQHTPEELDQAYKGLAEEGMKALILDFRYNPGGLLEAGTEVVNRFLDTGLIVRTQGRASVHNEIYANPYETYKPDLPLVILVNEYSASASEVVGGALQDHGRAVLLGKRTFGKGSVQNMIDLDGNGAIRLTIAYYYTPLGRLVHRIPGAKTWGLEPDVLEAISVEDSIKLREEWGKVAGGAEPQSLGEADGDVLDTQLSRALEVLEKKLEPEPEAAPVAGE